jgi:undecaprenyl-diphosphatase
VLKLPSLAEPVGAHIRGQVIVGFLVCAAAAYRSVRFLVNCIETRTLTPFAIFCQVVGAASVIRFA